MNDNHQNNGPAEPAPLELDHDLRLHAQRLKLGKAELLTDAVRLPFTDIESRLNQYAIGAAAEESEQLRKSMKHYLGRLNSNPLIPLQFRMKVLNRFEQDLGLFDGEMTAAVLNSHKIAVEMVQKAAISNKAYYADLVDMLSNSIELALKLLLIAQQKYQAPAVIATRQFFELARLGLGVAALLDQAKQMNVKRLHKTICEFELLRCLDFYGKTAEQQQLTWKELHYHLDSLQACLCRRNEPHAPFNGSRFLVTNLNRPNDTARVLTELPESLEYDCILIPIDTLFSRVSTAVERIQSLVNSQDTHKDLFTEEAMLTTLVGGRAILKALETSNRERERERSDFSDGQFLLEWDAAKALNCLGEAINSNGRITPGEQLRQQAWQIHNISDQGVCIVKTEQSSTYDHVGKLIGLTLLRKQGDAGSATDSTEACGQSRFKLGFIRWAKEIKAGEQRLGIEFLQGRLQLLNGLMLGGGKHMDLNRSWPVLITEAGMGNHTALFPDPRVYRNMTFLLLKNEQQVHYRIKRVLQKGVNYSLCNIVRAKVEGRSET